MLNKWNYVCLSLCILIILNFAMDKYIDSYFEDEDITFISYDEGFIDEDTVDRDQEICDEDDYV